MPQLLVAAIFASWFGRLALQSGRRVFPWAIAGAGIFYGLVTLLLLAGVGIAEAADFGAGVATLLIVSAWITAIVATAVIGNRFVS